MDISSINLKCSCLKAIKYWKKFLSKICYSDAKNSDGEDNDKN